jgi:hypothetical protein
MLAALAPGIPFHPGTCRTQVIINGGKNLGGESDGFRKPTLQPTEIYMGHHTHSSANV